MNPILFLDIDGVLLPQRMYDAPGQTRPFVTKFDPGVVGMLNRLGEDVGARFVIHSSWLRSGFVTRQTGQDTVQDHMIAEGLKEEYFHEDHSCMYRFSGTRWLAIREWLQDHPEVGPLDYWILEDEPHPYADGQYGENQINLDRIIQTEFNEGLTYAQYMQILSAEITS